MTNDIKTSNKEKTPYRTESDLSTLRYLLLSPEQAEITQLKERLDNNELRADEVSRVLAEAIIIRASRDEKLAQALLPTIEQVIRESVRKDPKFLADAIFPVIGPAIRKAIAESIRSMVQSLNETLTYALSWQGLKWRLESIRTGKPFAEIVLLHTLIFRVEQVFLIHRKTGLLLQHVDAALPGVKDADMVSGMLTAIQDFVQDSFGVEEKQVLQSLNVGEFTIWIEYGSEILVAAAIRGNPPIEYRIELEKAVGKIEFEQSEVLRTFDGDTAPFSTSRYHLNNCLVQVRGNVKKEAAISKPPTRDKSKPAKKKNGSDIMWLIIGVGMACLLIIIAGIIFTLVG